MEILLSGESLQAQVRSIRQGAWGGHLELQALADAHGVLVQVWQHEGAPEGAGTMVIRNLIQPVRKTSPKRVVRLLYNEAPGAADGDHFDTVWLRCPQCASTPSGVAIAPTAIAPTGVNGSASAPVDLRPQTSEPGEDGRNGQANEAGLTARQGGDCTAAVEEGSGPGLPRQFAEALAMVGLPPHQWRQVGPSEL